MFSKRRASVIVQGVIQETLFDLLKKRKVKEVVVLEGRPRLEAVRHSCRQLLKRKIKPVVVADSAAGFLFYKDLVKEVWIAYQMVDKKGALCDVGALILGVLGKQHAVPVNLYAGVKRYKMIGDENDTLSFNGTRVAPLGVKAYVPLMEWLPRKYIAKVYKG